MKITVISVGKIKEGYLRDAITHYSSILQRKVELFLVEVNDEKAPENLSEKLMIQVKDSEGANILKHIKDDMFVITLEILGKELNQDQLVKKLKQATNMNKNHICFIIGGSLGLSDKVSKRSNFKFSFSKMTFPHQVMKVMLLNQLSVIDYTNS